MASLISNGIFLVLLALPFLLNYYILSKRRFLNLKEVKSKYGESYEAFNNKSKYQILFNSYFLMRRLFYALFLVFITEMPIIQAAFLTNTSLVMILYFVEVKPYK